MMWSDKPGNRRDCSNDSRLHVVELPRGRSFILKIGVVVVVDLPLLRVAVEGSDNPVSLEKPCQASLPPDQQVRHNQRSSMLLEVYRCVQLKRWSVVCGCVLHRGQRGVGWCVSSTFCRYDIRM